MITLHVTPNHDFHYGSEDAMHEDRQRLVNNARGLDHKARSSNDPSYAERLQAALEILDLWLQAWSTWKC